MDLKEQVLAKLAAANTPERQHAAHLEMIRRFPHMLDHLTKSRDGIPTEEEKGVATLALFEQQ